MRTEQEYKNLEEAKDATIAQQAEQLAALEKERDHWKANHDNRVEAARLLIDRPDLPLERVKAYQAHIALQAKITEQAAEIERQRKVIELCKEAMTLDVGGEPLPTLEVEALAAIAELEQGVG